MNRRRNVLLPTYLLGVENRTERTMRRARAIFVLIIGLAFHRASVAGPLPAACLDFGRYPAQELFGGPYVAPDVVSTPLARKYRTAIKDGAAGPPNFAGRFSVVQWGCGSNCIRFALVDRSTGRVIEVPNGAALGAMYRADSRLIVIDHPKLVKNAFGNENPLGMWPIAYVWQEESGTLRPIDNCNGYGN